MNKEVNNNNTDVRNNTRKPPPEIKLPFDKRKAETGEWVYDNRISLLVTVIIYLIIMISFVFSKIVIDQNTRRSEIIIDFAELDKLQKELEEAQKLNRELNMQEMNDYISNVRNVISNEEGNPENERNNIRSSVTEELMSRADQALESSRHTRELYEAGLKQEQEMKNRQGQQKDDESGGQRQDTKVQGNVTVSFSLKNPTRSAVNLFVPAYQCRTGGTVVVDITVNQKGDVINAAVDKARSSSDYCMTSTALSAAYNSRFNVHPDAPQKHTGTITYIFVPQ